MNTSNFRFTLDLQSTQSQVAISVTRGDTARTWLISFRDGSNIYKISDGCLAKLEIMRPTGTHIEEFCPIENHSTVRYSFSQNKNTAAVEGFHECAVVLYDEEGHIIGSPRFSMIVSGRVINSDSSNSYDENKTSIDAMIVEEVSRKNAEAARADAESERISDEVARTKAEAQRAQNEAARQTADDERSLAEENRSQRFETLQREINTAVASLVSPTVTVNSMENGHQVTVTDYNGKHMFSVINGKDGSQGIPGTTGKNAYQYALEGGYTGTEAEFAEDINPVNIKAEVTPKKGVDYFDGQDYILTEADKAEIAEMVDGATIVQAPKYVNSVDEMTDQSRLYVMASTGRIWAYMDTSVEKKVTVTDELDDKQYYDGSRLGSSATSLTDGFSNDATGYLVTPLIDLTKSKYAGKTIQIHLEGARYVTNDTETWIMHRYYKTDGTVQYARGNSSLTSSDSMGQWQNATITINGDTSATITINMPLLFGATNVQCGYLRFCGKGAAADSHVYITYQDVQTVTGGQWVDTGTSYSLSISNEDLTTIAEQAAAIVDNNLLSIIGSGEVSV